MLFFIVFILIIGFLVLIHELGHFLVAKKAGIRVEEFGMGFPPSVWKKQKGETTYSLNLIPLGGFVRLFGEDGVKEEEKSHPRSFYAKSPAIKIGVLIAGVISNFLIATIIFYFLLIQAGFTFTLGMLPGQDYHFPFGDQENFVAISAVLPDSPAEEAGIKANSLVINANQEKFEDVESFIGFIEKNKGNKVNLELRDIESEEQNLFEVFLREDNLEEGSLGVGLAGISQIKYIKPIDKAASGFLHSLNFTHFTLASLGHLVGKSVKEKNINYMASAVMGPVGILAFTKITLEEGFIAVLSLMALISLALAIINLFPIPALDGGRILFICIETLTRKKIPPKVEQNTNLAGFIFLISIMILVTYKDIVQFGSFIFQQ